VQILYNGRDYIIYAVKDRKWAQIERDDLRNLLSTLAESIRVASSRGLIYVINLHVEQAEQREDFFAILRELRCSMFHIEWCVNKVNPDVRIRKIRTLRVLQYVGDNGYLVERRIGVSSTGMEYLESRISNLISRRGSYVPMSAEGAVKLHRHLRNYVKFNKVYLVHSKMGYLLVNNKETVWEHVSVDQLLYLAEELSLPYSGSQKIQILIHVLEGENQLVKQHVQMIFEKNYAEVWLLDHSMELKIIESSLSTVSFRKGTISDFVNGMMLSTGEIVAHPLQFGLVEVQDPRRTVIIPISVPLVEIKAPPVIKVTEENKTKKIRDLLQAVRLFDTNLSIADKLVLERADQLVSKIVGTRMEERQGLIIPDSVVRPVI
jgi:hypothetical protein